MKVYLIGSLRNPSIPEIANALEAACPGVEVFDEWFSGGEIADDSWKAHQIARGRDYKTAIRGHAARNIFAFDHKHIDESDAGVLVLPAGRSGHLELGYMVGRGKRTAILIDDPDRWDVMTQFADLVTTSVDEVAAWLKTPATAAETEVCRDCGSARLLRFYHQNIEIGSISWTER